MKIEKSKEDKSKDRIFFDTLYKKLDELCSEVDGFSCHDYKLFKHEKENLINYLEQIAGEIKEIKTEKIKLDDAPF